MATAGALKRVAVRIARPHMLPLRAQLEARALPESERRAYFRVSQTGAASIYTLCDLDGADRAPDSDADAAVGFAVTGLLRLLPRAGRAPFEREIGNWLARPPAEAGGPCLTMLIGLEDDGTLRFWSRVRDDSGWRDVGAFFVEGEAGARVWVGARPPAEPDLPPERVARFTSSFGIEAYQRLRRSSVVVIGAGGTGSVTIPTLARAGVGKIVIVDSDHVTPSNLERTQASFPEHVEARTMKAVLARDHVRRIDPDIEVVAIAGRLPQRPVVEAVVEADVMIGCTDQHSSRLAISDLARRYLVPAIDCGGLIEGADGLVSGQIIQLVLFRPDDPCPVCREMVDPVRVRQELMSPADRQALKAATGEAGPPPEAREIPQIDTVGYITTISGTLAAAYAIGWLTGRFQPPFERLQMNLVAENLDVTNRPQPHDPHCGCRAARGLGDDGAALAPFDVPEHWAPAWLLG